MHSASERAHNHPIATALGRCFYVYQPIVSVRDGCYAFEALIRKRSSEGKVLTPDAFLEALQGHAHDDLTGHTLHATTSELAELLAQGSCHLALNFSPQQILKGSLLEHLRELPSHLLRCLEVEVTEQPEQDLTGLADRLEAIRSLGVAVQLDDVVPGTLFQTRLEQLPLSGVKIDRHTIYHSLGNASEASRLASFIARLRASGLSVTAEGISELEQYTQLASMGCDRMQGYLIGRPIRGDLIPTFKP